MIIEFLITNINYFAFILCAFMGGLAHYLKKFLKQETNVKIYEWFGTSNALASIYTGIVFFFILVGTLSSGIITQEMNFWAVMYTGFMTGFAIDSGVNSDARTITKDMITINTDANDLRDIGKNQKEDIKT